MVLSYSTALHLIQEYFRRKGEIFPEKRNPFFQLNFYEFSITDYSKTLVSRNRIFVIKNERYPSFNLLIKQAFKFENEYIYTIQVEAEFYDMVKSKIHLQKYLPKSFGFDDENYLLIRQWDDINTPFYYSKDRQDKNIFFLKGLKKCLLDFDKYLNIKTKSTIFSANHPSFVLSFSEEKRHFEEQFGDLRSRKLYALTKRYSQISNQIEATIKDYIPNRIIHGDLRTSNILWNEKKESIKIIDWECAKFGDYRWDYATLVFELILTFYDPLNCGRSLKLISDLMSSLLDEFSISNKNIVLNFAGIKLLEILLGSDQNIEEMPLFEIAKELLLPTDNLGFI
jgi:thiamine kinase-like enzyme